MHRNWYILERAFPARIVSFEAIGLKKCLSSRKLFGTEHDFFGVAEGKWKTGFLWLLFRDVRGLGYMLGEG